PVRGEVAQRGQPALAGHALRGLGGGGEDAMHTACLVADGAEGQGEVALLTIPVPVERKEEVVGEGRLAPPQRTLEHRSDDVPDVDPALASGSPQGTRVIAGADHRTGGGVGEGD